MRIKDIPNLDRPREKAIKYGVEKISNSELLAIILRSGIKGQSSIELAYEILKKTNGLNGLKNITLNQLKNIKGISNVKSIQLLAAIELAKRINDNIDINQKIYGGLDVYNLIGDLLKYEEQEHFALILLDIKNNLIMHKILYKGGLNFHLVHMRDIFREVVRNNAYKFICVHNHPTGDPTPSKNDYSTTMEILKNSIMMGIKFEDHIIIGHNCYYSFKESSDIFKKY